MRKISNIKHEEKQSVQINYYATKENHNMTSILNLLYTAERISNWQHITVIDTLKVAAKESIQYVQNP